MTSFTTPKVTFTDPKALREQDIALQLKEKGPDGYYKGGIVWEELRGPRGEPLGKVMHIGNPYLDNPSYLTLPTNCTKEQIDKIRSKIIWHEEACQIFTAIAESFKMGHMLVIEGESSIGKTYLVNRFCECRFGPGVKPIKQPCSKHMEVAELTGRFIPNTGPSADKNAGPWKIQLGTVPQAFLAKLEADGRYSFPTEGGEGAILDVEEPNTAPPGVTNFLLHIRGVNKKVADSIVIHDLDDLEVRRGPNCWVAFTINPCDGDYLERHPLDPALARACDFQVFGDLSAKSYLMSAQKYFAYTLGNRPASRPANCILEIYKHPEIGKEIAEIVSTFHMAYKSALKKGEKNREQKIPGTLDDIAAVSEFMISLQSRSATTGDFDIIDTLTRAIRKTYIQRHKDPKVLQNLEGAFQAILTDATVGRKSFRGTLCTRVEILETLVSEASADPAQRVRRAQAQHQAALRGLMEDAGVPERIKKLIRSAAA